MKKDYLSGIFLKELYYFPGTMQGNIDYFKGWHLDYFKRHFLFSERVHFFFSKGVKSSWTSPPNSYLLKRHHQSAKPSIWNDLI